MKKNMLINNISAVFSFIFALSKGSFHAWISKGLIFRSFQAAVSTTGYIFAIISS